MNKRRIQAAIRFCEGIPTERMEAARPGEGAEMLKAIDAITQEMRAALQEQEKPPF